MDPQLKKGFLEYCVLAILKKADSYGYQIIQQVQDVIEISESTLYPMLKRLEKKELIHSYTQEYNGRLRKYYRLTDQGNAAISQFLMEWHLIEKIHDFISEGQEDD